MRTIKNKFVKWDRVVDQETQEWNNMTDRIRTLVNTIYGHWLLTYLRSLALWLNGVTATGYDVMSVMTYAKTKKEAQDPSDH